MGDYDDYDGDGGGRGGGGGAFKWCLIVGCTLVLVAGCAIGIGAYSFYKSTVITDAAGAQQNLQATLDCQVPDGYEVAPFGMNMMGQMRFTMIGPPGMMNGGGGNNPNLPLMIMVMSFPAGSNQAQMEAQMRQSMAQGSGGGGGGGMTLESEQEVQVTVRGEQVPFRELVQVDRQGQKIRQVLGVITRQAGGGGPVMIMAIGNHDSFDQAAFDAFLGSIDADSSAPAPDPVEVESEVEVDGGE